MNEQQINLKTVFQLRIDEAGRPFRYYIPAYQRGYRWEPKQVTQLLEDIWEFTKRANPQPEEFYCLQPLVLRLKEDGSYEVVDGQQRLTTLFLILRHFNERLAPRFRETLYELEYETRTGLVGFLEAPSDEQAQSNIDFFHVNEAVKIIDDWIEGDEHRNDVDTIKAALLNQAKVIWFQLAVDEDPVDAFTRLNVGKIALTNGELIRALFLKGSKNSLAQLSQVRIAHEWDQIEKSLQDDDLWCFVSNEVNKRGNRIGFLFDLIAREGGMERSSDTYATFYHFSAKLNEKSADPEAEWLAVKGAFMQLEEWFKDRRLYHLVGFLIWDGVDIKELRKLAKEKTKRQFKESLRAEIFERAMKPLKREALYADGLRDVIDERMRLFEYPGNRAQIKAILLLFNLASLLLNPVSNLRFQFEGFKTEEWDIEHIRSVADARLDSLKDQREWLMHCLRYLQLSSNASDLQTEIEDFIKLPPADASITRFEALYGHVVKHFGELDEEEPDHSIANLVLLDANTNRSYKNAVFAVKRQRVLDLDRDGIFVPLSTRNVFLKCYKPYVEHTMFWTKDDRDGYQAAIVDTLHNLFRGEWVHE
ncbi:DUF262 domain-containing protein [Paraburkholderia sp. RL17-337-BIB-A]|uniref:DUF262 domain-containing protein n=1 Tax=Paraburkholderia sp. RL17-337-BIB-A TaxID=3031636 RepID=UPI0038BD59F3